MLGYGKVIMASKETKATITEVKTPNTPVVQFFLLPIALDSTCSGPQWGASGHRAGDVSRAARNAARR